MENLLIVFVKAPVEGQVKTRLSPPLSLFAAKELYLRMARSIYQGVAQIAGVRVAVAYATQKNYPSPNWLWDNLKTQAAFEWFAQSGEDLGERLVGAFNWGFAQGAARVSVIGTDSPGLPANQILLAFNLLKDKDLVLGPALDGGYYLVGLNSPIADLMFGGVKWSGPDVLETTLRRCRSLGKSAGLLPAYFDIDVAEDLKYLETPELRHLLGLNE